MRRQANQLGFSLIAAIFLLAVLAVIMVNVIRLGVVQHSTVALGLQGARGLQAARAGIEYGVFRALNDGICNASESLSFPSAATVLAGFTVETECAVTSHIEGSRQVDVYQFTATASYGAYAAGSAANPDYVQRKIRATVSNSPP